MQAVQDNRAKYSQRLPWASHRHMSMYIADFLRDPIKKGHCAVVAGAVCISFAALFVKDAPIDPSMVALYRLLFGGAALVIFAVLRKERLVPSRSILPYMLLAAFFFSADLTAWHASIVRIGPGLATILANFQVFFLALFGACVLKEQLSLRHTLAMPLALIGLCLLLEVNPGKLPGNIAEGVVFGLATALFYTIYILALRRSQSGNDKLPAIANMAVVSLIACFLEGIFCAGAGISFSIPDMHTFLLLAALGILCQATGWFLLSTGLPHMPASRAGLIMLTQPALSFLWDIIFCQRPTGIIGYAGALVSIGAIYMGLAKTKKKSP